VLGWMRILAAFDIVFVSVSIWISGYLLSES
jgi:hypothetical protein